MIVMNWMIAIVVVIFVMIYDILNDICSTGGHSDRDELDNSDGCK